MPRPAIPGKRLNIRLSDATFKKIRELRRALRPFTLAVNLDKSGHDSDTMTIRRAVVLMHYLASLEASGRSVFYEGYDGVPRPLVIVPPASGPAPDWMISDTSDP